MTTPGAAGEREAMDGFPLGLVLAAIQGRAYHEVERLVRAWQARAALAAPPSERPCCEAPVLVCATCGTASGYGGPPPPSEPCPRCGATCPDAVATTDARGYCDHAPPSEPPGLIPASREEVRERLRAVSAADATLPALFSEEMVDAIWWWCEEARTFGTIIPLAVTAWERGESYRRLATKEPPGRDALVLGTYADAMKGSTPPSDTARKLARVAAATYFSMDLDRPGGRIRTLEGLIGHAIDAALASAPAPGLTPLLPEQRAFYEAARAFFSGDGSDDGDNELPRIHDPQFDRVWPTFDAMLAAERAAPPASASPEGGREGA